MGALNMGGRMMLKTIDLEEIQGEHVKWIQLICEYSNSIL
jgi:hypothetical protein